MVRMSSIDAFSYWIRRRVALVNPWPCAMPSVFVMVVVQPLHLDAGFGDFREQSAMLNFVRFYARRHDIHHNLENRVWRVADQVRTA
jgi:hypothetical protein